MENRSLNSEDPFLEDRAPASLESLPLELMWEILYRLDSQGLNSLVNISPQYYRAYTCNAQWILSEVVRREIGPECMYEAVAVIQASNIRSREDQATIEFLRRYRLERWEEPPQVLSLSASLQLISFHQSIVSGFVNDFISSTLSRYPMRQTPLKPDGPPSANELRRIYRAFYRFELYCVLFRRRPTEPRLVSISDGRLAASDQYRHFLYFLPPWEVEELFCVHDYLYRRIFVPVDDYLGHDIARGLQGSWWVEDLFDMGNGLNEHFLSQGLSFIHRLLALTEYEEYGRIIEDNHDQDFDFLPTATEEYGRFRINDVLEDESDAEQEPTTPTQLAMLQAAGDFPWAGLESGVDLSFTGDEGGPNEGWLWANDYQNHMEPGNSPHMDLREWAYCMWDQPRLVDWGLLDQLSGVDRYMQRGRELFAESRARSDKLQQTERIRTRIYKKGGRGRWTESESQIVWTRLSRRNWRYWTSMLDMRWHGHRLKKAYSRRWPRARNDPV